MHELLMNILGTAITMLELAAAALLVLGVVLATINWARLGLVEHSPDARESYRRALGRVILIGLEVLLAATILKTITLTPTAESMGVLVATAAIRTAIGWTTSLEMNRRWPWQRRR